MKQNITVPAPTTTGQATSVSITINAENVAGTGPDSTSVPAKTTTVPPTKNPTAQPTPKPTPSAVQPTPKPTSAPKQFKVKMSMGMTGVTVAQVKTLKPAIERATAKKVDLDASKCKLDESSITATARRRLAGGVTFKVEIEASEDKVAQVESKVDEISSNPDSFVTQVQTEVAAIIKAGGAGASELQGLQDVVANIKVSNIGKVTEEVKTTVTAPTVKPTESVITDAAPYTQMSTICALAVLLVSSLVAVEQ